MPDRALGKIMTAMDPADVGQMAMIECLRQIADGNKTMGKVLEGVQTEVRDVRERLIRIEASKFEAAVADVKLEVTALELRVDELEADKNRREGALGLVEWAGRNWPAIIGFGALVALLLRNGSLL